MAMMDVFSEQSGSASLTQTQRFVWDSAIDGPIATPTLDFSLGTFGTAGKTIGSVRGRMLTDSVVTNFTGIPGGGIITISDVALGFNWFWYDDSGTEDQLTTDGWQVPVSGNDNAQLDTTQIGVGPVEVVIHIEKFGETWNLTGRMEFIFEWVESE